MPLITPSVWSMTAANCRRTDRIVRRPATGCYGGLVEDVAV
jgi:hypothetical protein